MTSMCPTPPRAGTGIPQLDGETAIAIARATALRLYRRGAIRRAEVDDFAGDLVLHAVKCWPKFNGQRSSVATFLSLIIPRAAISMLRARTAPQRDYRRCMYLTDITNSDSGVAAACPWSPTAVNHAKAVDFHHDIEVVVAQLPIELQTYCALLKSMTEHEIVRLLKVSRYHVAARIGEIRRCFEAAGLNEYL